MKKPQPLSALRASAGAVELSAGRASAPLAAGVVSTAGAATASDGAQPSLAAEPLSADGVLSAAGAAASAAGGAPESAAAVVIAVRGGLGAPFVAEGVVDAVEVDGAEFAGWVPARSRWYNIDTNQRCTVSSCRRRRCCATPTVT